VQKLSQAKNFEEVVKIQTEFMEAQINSFNEGKNTQRDIYQSGARCDEYALSLIGQNAAVERT